MSRIDELVGGNIRTYRKAKRITLDELAQLIHKSRATVGKYEQGDIALDIDTLCEIAKTLGVTPPQLLLDISATEERCAGVDAETARKYLYLYDGRTNRIVRGLLISGQGVNEPPVTLFYNVHSFDAPQGCRALYIGKCERHDFVTNYVLQNQSNEIEHVSICVMKPLECAALETGLIAGISSRAMLPASAKCILSDRELVEDEQLIGQLMLTKEDLKLTKKYNMFVVEQTEGR